MKSRLSLPASPDAPRILGYDAAGVVEAAGPGCTLFRPGDAVRADDGPIGRVSLRFGYSTATP